MPVERIDTAGGDWPSGMSQPALRALAGAGIERLDQLREVTESDIKKLQGMGPSGVALLKKALESRGLSFARKP